MHGIPFNELDDCPLLCDCSKHQLVSRYRHLLLVCVDHNREDIACWLLDHGFDYAVTDNMVIVINVTISS